MGATAYETETLHCLQKPEDATSDGGKGNSSDVDALVTDEIQSDGTLTRRSSKGIGNSRVLRKLPYVEVTVLLGNKKGKNSSPRFALFFE